MKIIVSTLCLLSYTIINAQNIVPNGSFEDYSKLPSSTSQFSSLKYWENPTTSKEGGTPDFYHYEAGADARLPSPSWADGLIIEARTGKGIGGIIASSGSMIREFMLVELSQNLIAGKKYKISFYYSNGQKKEVGAYATKLGIGLSTNKPDQKKWEVLPVDQVVQSENILFSNEWAQLSIEFTATGNYKYFSLGNFSSDNSNYDKRAKDFVFGDWSYYFVDDIELVETTGKIEEPKKVEELVPVKKEEVVITKSEEEILEKASQVQFKTGESKLLPESYKALDEVVELLKKYPEGFLSIEGHTDSDGNKEDNLILSQERAGAIMSYFIKKGIPENRLRAVGHGSNRPKTDDNSSAGKAKNRRVEMKFSSRKLKTVF